MPRTKRALSENKAPGVRQEPSSPRAEHRKSVKGSKPPGSAATRPQRRQPQLCKHFAASARRRNCANSLRRFFAELLKTRIFAQRIPERVELQVGGCYACRS